MGPGVSPVAWPLIRHIPVCELLKSLLLVHFPAKTSYKYQFTLLFNCMQKGAEQALYIK